MPQCFGCSCYLSVSDAAPKVALSLLGPVPSVDQLPYCQRCTSLALLPSFPPREMSMLFRLTPSKPRSKPSEPYPALT